MHLHEATGGYPITHVQTDSLTPLRLWGGHPSFQLLPLCDSPVNVRPAPGVKPYDGRACVGVSGKTRSCKPSSVTFHTMMPSM